MAGGKEIRTKIRSVQNTQKITRAMEMVAASKMRKAQDRMKAARPYAEKVRNVAAHLAESTTDYKHPFLVAHKTVKRIGIVVVTSDKGLCGGLNTNLLRLVVNKMKEAKDQGIEVSITAIGNKGFGFMNRLKANIVSHEVGLGDTPHLSRLIGSFTVMLNAYANNEIDELYVAYNHFINTMKQEPTLERLLPIPESALGKRDHSWDYLYEPDPVTLIDQLLRRYVEAVLYQAVTENMASEQSARMVAMKAASDNAGNVIDELKLMYNKSRQAAITKELAEIVSGAAAV